jgi:hypothetical protein
MVRQFVAVLMALVCLLVCGPTSAAGAAAQASSEEKRSLKEQVVMIPAGSVVEVKLKQKASSTIRGRLRAITDEGFEVQIAKSGKISSEKVAFTEVKSVKAKPGMSFVTKAFIATGVGVLVLLVIGVIAAAAG